MAQTPQIDSANIAFWEAVGENGPVHWSELNSRVSEVLTEHPEFITLDKADSYALYSGGMGHGGAWQAAVDLSDRTDGVVGIIDDTDAGKALMPYVDMTERDLDAAKATYGDFIEFPFTETDVAQFKDDGIRNIFQPASSHFAAHAHGNVVTLTPNSDTYLVFARSEVPVIADGMRPDANGVRRITHVNGVPSEAFDDVLRDLPKIDGDPYAAAEETFDLKTKTSAFDPLREEMGATFREQFRIAGGDIHADPSLDGTRWSSRTVLELDESAVRRLLPESGAQLAPGRFDGLISAVDMNAQLESAPGQLATADKAGDLRSFAHPDGETAFLHDQKTNTLYRARFDAETGSQTLVHAERYPDADAADIAFGKVWEETAGASPRGLPIQRGLGELGEHLTHASRADWLQDATRMADMGGSVLSRASKILGPLGIAAVGAEAHALETKLRDFEDMHLVPEEAMLAFRGILGGHVAQATLDPTMLGGEVATQAAFDKWVEAYEISPEVARELEPGSLLEDLDAGRKWLGAHAKAAGENMADYASSRMEDPTRVLEDLQSVRAATREAVAEAAQKGWEAAGVAADALGDYAADRWHNPERLADDASAVGQAVGGTVSGWAGKAWESTFGGKEDDHAMETAPAIQQPWSLELDTALSNLSADVEAIQVADPGMQSDLAQALSHPDAMGTFRALKMDGVQTLEVDYGEDATPEQRAQSILLSGYREMRERGLEPVRDANAHDPAGIELHDPSYMTAQPVEDDVAAGL